MARIDKVVQVVRATAGTALTGVLGVGLDAGGSVVPGGGVTGIVGVVVLPGTIAAGRPVGILRQGEVVEFGGSAATNYSAGTADGTISSSGDTAVGFTVEADRLVVDL